MKTSLFPMIRNIPVAEQSAALSFLKSLAKSPDRMRAREAFHTEDGRIQFQVFAGAKQFFCQALGNGTNWPELRHSDFLVQLRYRGQKPKTLRGVHASRRLFFESSLTALHHGAFSTAEALCHTLLGARDAIAVERNRDHYALGTLCNALIAGGCILVRIRHYSQYIGSFEFFDRSPSLQGIVAADVLSDPIKTLHWLEARQRQISVELGRRRCPIDESGQIRQWTLHELLIILAARRLIPKQAYRSYKMHASNLLFYRRSEILQNQVSEAVLADTLLLLQCLSSHHGSLDAEQGGGRSYPLAKYVWALRTAERLAPDRARHVAIMASIYSQHNLSHPERLDVLFETMRIANARDPVHCTYLLADFRSERADLSGCALSVLADAMALDERFSLIGMTRHEINQLTVAYDFYLKWKDPFDKARSRVKSIPDFLQALVALQQKHQALAQFSLRFLCDAFYLGQRIGDSRLLQRYQRAASAVDFFRRWTMLHDLAVPIKKSQDRHFAAKQWKFIQDLASIQESHVALQKYSLRHLIAAVLYGQATEGPLVVNHDWQGFERAASSCDFFRRSPLLQEEAARIALLEPIEAIGVLHRMRPQIIAEQQAAGKTELRRLSLSYLVECLFVAGHLRQSYRLYGELASGLDRYDDSETLQATADHAYEDPDDRSTYDEKALVRYLLKFRDRIWWELHPEDDSLENVYALGTLCTSLLAARIIDAQQFQRLQRSILAPLDYFLKRRDIIEPELRRAIRLKASGGINLVDRKKFTRLDRPETVASRSYISQIIMWGRWLLSQSDVPLRSRFSGLEIGVMIGLGTEPVPPRVATNLALIAEFGETNPESAREIAVATIPLFLALQPPHADAQSNGHAEILADLYAQNRDAIDVA
jgi:hypothetical protein